MRVSTRAMSLRNVRRRAGFSNCALACCRRRLNISWRRSRPSADNSTSVASLIFESEYFINSVGAVKSVTVPRNKPRLDGQLGGRQAERFAGDGFRDTIHFKKHVGGPNDG